MKKNTYQGLFIAFEGLDGSGSSILASLVAGVLNKEGYRVHLTKEPTNNLIGGVIRANLSGEWQADQNCLQLLFTADRAKHLQQEIIPNLQAGRIVITDRYAFSSMAYSSLDIEDKNWLEKINDRFVLPDLTFLIKVSPKVCALRIKQAHFEMGLYDEEQKLAKVWQAYEELNEKYQNIKIIDGQRDEMEIIKEIVDIIKKQLTK